MKISNNTVLIIGGSAGIGFESAKAFLAAGNKVIITGRNKERLDNAVKQLPGVTGIQGDVSEEKDVDALITTLKKDFPTLNIIMNNAGKAYLHNLATEVGAFEKAQDEMFTNYLSIVRMNEKMIPLLSSQKESAIINVSSVVAIVPGALSTYSASKAALHSYTLSLRLSLQRSEKSIKVFELMPPLVNTELSKEIGGEKNGIAPSIVADALLEAIKNDTFEIHVGKTQYIYDLYLKSPEEALAALNNR